MLSRREHTRTELQRKLLARAQPAEIVSKVLQQLEEQGLQSDDRFTEQYVRQRRDKGYGPLRIRAELKERGVDGVLIDGWLDAGDQEWRSLMEQAVIKKYGQTPPRDNQKEIARCGRFLAQRGFPPRLIRELVFNE